MKDELHLHKALKELEEYRAIGTVKKFKEVLGRQHPKKLHIYANGTEHCPYCDYDNTSLGFKVCVECGQVLDWER